MSRRCALPGLLLGLLGVVCGCEPLRQVLTGGTDTPVAAKPPPLPPPDRPEPPAQPLRQPRNILALSGGGAYGAFTAGVLNGWTRSNNRPEFDVVTGVSTGALIAPMAFLGPQYDDEIKKFYTEIRQRDVFSIRAWATIPFRDAVATSAPLRRVIAAGITDDVVAAIAAEHRKGRRLYVATTHLGSRRTVVWDLGAIAARGGPDARKQLCDILLASCSIPGVLPPVPLAVDTDGKTHTELHVDGGVTTSVFIPPQVLEAARPSADRPVLTPPNLYVIVAGKYYPESAPVRPRVFRVLKASGGALLHAQARRDLSNLYHMAKLTGVGYHSVALPASSLIRDAAMDFDQAVMSRLYAEGVKVGVAGPVWDTAPPERGAGETDDIRTGAHLRRKKGD
jgi:predicted acylesterase/phospholipase RssA